MLYSYRIAHEARSVTASDIYRAASRCESSGNKAAHAQPAFVSTFYVLPDPTLVDHKISSSTCWIGTPSQVKAGCINGTVLGGCESTCGRMPTLKCVRPHECCSPLKQCVSQITFRQNDVTPLELSLSAPSRCLTQEAVSTANTRNAIITRDEPSCLNRVRRIFCFRSCTLDNTQETRSTVGCTGRAVGQGGKSYVFLSAKNMREVWATSRRWYLITSLWKLSCCEVLLLCVPN